jgi:hypothetical protein
MTCFGSRTAVALFALLALGSCEDEPLLVPQLLALDITGEATDQLPHVPATLVLLPKHRAILHVSGASAEGSYDFSRGWLSVAFPEGERAGVALPLTTARRCPSGIRMEGLGLAVSVVDGVITTATGGGAAYVTHSLDNDSAIPFPIPLAVTGTGAPQSSLLSRRGAHHPLEIIEPRIDGPADFPRLWLASTDTSEELVRSDGPIAPLSATVSKYVRTTGAPLAWGTSYTIAANEGERDAYGRTLTPSSFTTHAAPAHFDSPELEGTVHGLFSGARISTAADEDWSAPHEGTGALFLESPGSATFTFPAAEAGTRATLLLRARYFRLIPTLVLRFFDESEVVTVEVHPGGAFVPGDADSVASIAVPLPELARTHAFSLEIENPYIGQCGNIPALRLEAVIESLRFP